MEKQKRKNDEATTIPTIITPWVMQQVLLGLALVIGWFVIGIVFLLEDTSHLAGNIYTGIYFVVAVFLLTWNQRYLIKRFSDVNLKHWATTSAIGAGIGTLWLHLFTFIGNQLPRIFVLELVLAVLVNIVPIIILFAEQWLILKSHLPLSHHRLAHIYTAYNVLAFIGFFLAYFILFFGAVFVWALLIYFQARMLKRIIVALRLSNLKQKHTPNHRS
ncbi:MAG: hypothetical protein AAF846_23680 [Chloroflexota bacterium]